MVNNKKLTKEQKLKKEYKKREKKINYGLFDNPMVQNIMKSMSSDEISKYKKIGEELYGNINFETSKIENNQPVPANEALTYITSALKSGLSIDDLEESEIKFLNNYYGDDWEDKLNLRNT